MAPLLAVERETAIIAALIALGVAGLVVSIGAWILLFRSQDSEDDRA